MGRIHRKATNSGRGCAGSELRRGGIGLITRGGPSDAVLPSGQGHARYGTEMFGPQHLTHVIAYFDGVDGALSQRMLRKHPPDEPALTNELCALLDAETQRIEGRPAYGADQLNSHLAAAGDGLDIEVTLDTYPHNSAMERHVSQSDFGLVLDYENRVLPEESWSTAYLVQAKRAFRDPGSGKYDEKSRFEAANAEQQVRLDRLADILGHGALRYCLYCPPTPELTDIARTQVRALHTRNLTDRIFDYGAGLALRDTLVANGGINAGIWFAPIETKPARLVGLHDAAFRSALPLTWFLIEHFGPRTHGGWDACLLRGSPLLANRGEGPNHRVRGIVTGDDRAVRELVAQLSAAGEDREAPGSITVLPRHTITIKVTVGKVLPPDLARARLD